MLDQANEYDDIMSDELTPTSAAPSVPCKTTLELPEDCVQARDVKDARRLCRTWLPKEG